ncbi:MAG TPA: response regulator [bacterium]|nr:response regulator [bacterium]
MKRILVVDDEAGIVELLAIRLRDSGFTVDGAANGTQALELMDRYGHNLVLCDICLPDADGRQLVRAFKKRNPLCQVLLMTGHLPADNVTEAIAVGAVDFVSKPFYDLDGLLANVRELSDKVGRWKSADGMWGACPGCNRVRTAADEFAQ